MEDKKVLLSVKDLHVKFRVRGRTLTAIRGISLDLYEGESIAIVGESGSGKSVTSKAIMGISAVNAIYEGGEILYDGQDLMRIPEEEMHKLRGDKIAMIFQDPLSALNPIMRIGKQITEAMLLKNKANRKEGRVTFNKTLAELSEMMKKALAESPNTDISAQPLQLRVCGFYLRTRLQSWKVFPCLQCRPRQDRNPFESVQPLFWSEYRICRQFGC